MIFYARNINLGREFGERDEFEAADPITAFHMVHQPESDPLIQCRLHDCAVWVEISVTPHGPRL